MLRGGVLNGFYDIKPYMNWRAGAYLWPVPSNVPIMRFNNIYGLGMQFCTFPDVTPYINWKW